MIESCAGDNRHLRIALITTELAVGGAEQCLARLAIGLARRGFEPAVYSLLPPPAAPRDRLVRQLAAANLPLHFLGLRRAIQFRQGVAQLAELLERQHPDLIQSFLFHANILATFATRRLRRRTRSAPKALETRPTNHFEAAASSWSPATKLVTGWRVADQRPCRARLEARLTRQVDHVVCVSRSVAEQARRLGMPTSRLSVIPNGVDLSLFSSEQAFPQDASSRLALPPPATDSLPPTLLAIGRLDPQKGFDWLLQGASRLLAELPGFRLVIVGEGPERTRLAARIRAAGLEDRVELPGWQNDIPRRLQSATLVLIPSRWEGMPNVLLEAMASGRAVVATRVEGVEELLGPEAAPQTASAFDLDEFVDRAITLARNPNERHRLGAANADRVRERFSIDTMIDTYAALYARLCHGES